MRSAESKYTSYTVSVEGQIIYACHSDDFMLCISAYGQDRKK